MSDYFAYTPGTRPTGREVARLLGFRHFGIRPPGYELDLLIRWGSRRPMPYASKILNHSEAIRQASDKIRTMRALQEAGIRTVPWFEDWESAKRACDNTIIFGRTRQGMQGQGIRIYDPLLLHNGVYPVEPRLPDQWYSLYREPTREVRLHVVDGEVVRLQGKYLDFPEDQQRQPFVRNFRTGYRFRAPRRDVHMSRKEMAIEAVRALGLTFGAVDMLLFGGGQPAMILEVNSAPACSPLTAESYAEAINRRIGRSY
jgi:Glutathione synthase/Ribosomal protein S6 modification enzyme (glutaminyl transferase)